MNPREFVRRYQYDNRLITGRFYPEDPLTLEAGDRVGVVLLNLGGPATVQDVEPFLYNLFMDPAIIDLPVGGTLRHFLARLIARMRARKVARDYEQIGGGSPINLLTRQQADSLERQLNTRYAEAYGVQFRVFIAMRYWHPLSEEAAHEMQEAGINKVVLLPLYPQYSKTTSGASLLYWWTLEQAGEIPSWPTTYVFEYATYPKYVQAISERIDEALQRFPREVRQQVHIVFSAHGTPVREMAERGDPYCGLVNATVEKVMQHRGYDRPFHVSFQSKVGPAEWLAPSTIDKLQALAKADVKAVLMVPVAFVSDHIETAFELDIEVREEAKHFGIRHYEVTSGLNCHPLFIEALADVTRSKLVFAGERLEDRPIQYLVSAEERVRQCQQCRCIADQEVWKVQQPELVRIRTGQKK